MTIATTTLYQVDAFTSRPFSGNPAAVCILEKPATPDWMQKVASEMNLSETAFLVRQEGDWQIRFFTPKTEIDLCGHATLASAHILWQLGYQKPTATLTFYSQDAQLLARKDLDWIELNFPAKPVEAAPRDQAVAVALGVVPVGIYKNEAFHLVEVADEKAVRAVKPDFVKLAQVTHFGAVVTARAASSEYDCVSRCFFPNLGILEDPATGVAHCALGPFWQERLGKARLMALQASERGGILRVGADGERVTLGGQAVTMLKCELLSSTAA